MVAVDLVALFGSLMPVIERRPLSERETGAVFRGLMKSLVHFDNAVGFAYRGEERPVDFYDTFDAEKYDIHVTVYQAGAFLLDPFYHATRAERSGFFRMRELAPDRFFVSEYYRTYYGETRLAEEVGFFVPLTGGVGVVLSLMRLEQSGEFSPADIKVLRNAAPLVLALVRTGLGDIGTRLARSPVVPPTPFGEANAASNVWSRLGLTDREAMIVDLVLQGHSSEAIGLRLGISTGTVKVHRRNVYRKLDISSQTQLLSLYLGNLERS